MTQFLQIFKCDTFENYISTNFNTEQVHDLKANKQHLTIHPPILGLNTMGMYIKI